MGLLGLLLAYIILGFLRGAGDILPIEGSSHIAFAGELYKLLKMPEMGERIFDAVEIMRLGSFFGIVSYFWRESTQLLSVFTNYVLGRDALTQRKVSNILGDEMQAQFFMWIFLGLAASAAAALLMQRLLININPGAEWSTLGLIANGFIISITALFRSLGKKRIGDLGFRHLLFICVAQAFGTVPGLSRLALMISAALLCQLTWKEAVKLALILSLPTLLVYGLYGIYTHSNTYSLENWLFTGLSVLFSGIAAYLAINFLMTTSLHARNRFFAFGIYCISVGIFAYLMLFFPVS
jgi:undecaprenyl-diphosphatase